MKKYILTVGLTANKTGNFVPIARKTAIEKISVIMQFHGIQAYTIVDCTGYWEGKKEKSLQIIVIGALPVVNVCNWLKSNLLQDCIAVEITDTEFQLM